jgi:hypothetical protein
VYTHIYQLHTNTHVKYVHACMNDCIKPDKHTPRDAPHTYYVTSSYILHTMSHHHTYAKRRSAHIRTYVRITYYVRMYVLRTHTYVLRTYVRMYVCTYVCMHVRITYVCTYVCMRTYYAHIRTYVRITYVCTYVCMQRSALIRT